MIHKLIAIIAIATLSACVGTLNLDAGQLDTDITNGGARGTTLPPPGNSNGDYVFYREHDDWAFNVGEPLTRPTRHQEFAPNKVRWHGIFEITREIGDDREHFILPTFTFEYDFQKKSWEAPEIRAFECSRGYIKELCNIKLEGEWGTGIQNNDTDDGRLFGDIHIGHGEKSGNGRADVHGRIGSNGVWGNFESSPGSTRIYGGFRARPPKGQ